MECRQSGKSAEGVREIRTRNALRAKTKMRTRERSRLRPEKVNKAVLAADIFDGFLEGGDEAAFQAEGLEKFVPKGLFFGPFALNAGPGFREADGVMTDFVPGKRHG